MQNYKKVEWTNETRLTPENLNSMSDAIDYVVRRLDNKLTLVHNCMNCGASLEVEENKQIIHCKYCGSAYIYGSAQIYSKY